jgi:predicted secreted protein
MMSPVIVEGMMKLHHLLFCVLLLTTHGALAETEAAAYNRVDFDSEATREVNNDLMVATMSVEVSDREAAHVAQQINNILNEALKQAADFPAVKASSRNQNTYPVYGKNNALDSWRGHAELRLESTDFQAEGKLIGLLQEKMQLAGMQFAVAPETRSRIDEELTGEAIAAFRKRAEAVRAALDGKGYKLVHLSISRGDFPIATPMMAQGRMAAMAVPTPQFSGGESQVRVQVSATIEVIP